MPLHVLLSKRLEGGSNFTRLNWPKKLTGDRANLPHDNTRTYSR